MNYRHIYMRIVSHAKQEMELGLRPKSQFFKKNFPNQYFEFHHILPKSLFPNWTKRKSNIVALTAREHFFVHQLLTKIYPSQQMFYAITAFTRNPNVKISDYRITSKEYETLRILWSNMQKERMKIHVKWQLGTLSKGKHWWNNGSKEVFSKECPLGFTKGRIAKSEETRKKMSASAKRRGINPEQRKKMLANHKGAVAERNSNFGKHWFTNGFENILSSVPLEGFWKGRTLSKETLAKLKKCHKNCVAWNKGMNKASQILYRESISKR